MNVNGTHNPDKLMRVMAAYFHLPANARHTSAERTHIARNALCPRGEVGVVFGSSKERKVEKWTVIIVTDTA